MKRGGEAVGEGEAGREGGRGRPPARHAFRNFTD
jgi:hypothetical protein